MVRDWQATRHQVSARPPAGDAPFAALVEMQSGDGAARCNFHQLVGFRETCRQIAGCGRRGRASDSCCRLQREAQARRHQVLHFHPGQRRMSLRFTVEFVVDLERHFHSLIFPDSQIPRFPDFRQTILFRDFRVLPCQTGHAPHPRLSKIESESSKIETHFPWRMRLTAARVLLILCSRRFFRHAHRTS